jgi:hypothetical protein
MEKSEDKPLWAQRSALWWGLAAYTTFLLIYLFSRDIPYIHIRSDGAAWGQFGDYVGGVINPVVGLITIWLLTASLKQSQQEMALTTKALKDAEASQKATEAALRDQIKVSEHARDMGNAVELLQYYRTRYEYLRNHGKSNTDTRNRKHYGVLAEQMESIISQEMRRLLELYVPLDEHDTENEE